MTNAFIRKLARFAVFNDEETAALERLSAKPELHMRGKDLVRQGDRPNAARLLLSGWAYRYKVLRDGSRQIVAYLLPGDVCDIHGTMLGEMDHSIGLLTDAEVVTVPAEEMREVMDRHRLIERALWRASLADGAILREWLANIGQRDAFSRTGHHLCELWHRVKNIGLVSDSHEFDLPVTQEELGDSLGLTSVHVNRTIKRLRDEELITLKNKRLTLLDPERLSHITGFDPAYIR
ncbi:MAG: Crp/Fnr family transcriptional regulator [Pseudomonadota bacterium]|nr:Crp/Fnr family transcriptional regulator [Pseudomonadota bacterium]